MLCARSLARRAREGRDKSSVGEGDNDRFFFLSPRFDFARFWQEAGRCPGGWTAQIFIRRPLVWWNIHVWEMDCDWCDFGHCIGGLEIVLKFCRNVVESNIWSTLYYCTWLQFGLYIYQNKLNKFNEDAEKIANKTKITFRIKFGARLELRITDWRETLAGKQIFKTVLQYLCGNKYGSLPIYRVDDPLY